ncbi:zinc finger protein [Nocardiopsis trehalosi]|jgi:transposase|nr:zinc finger protein [Nocardiopsis trehalosi]
MTQRPAPESAPAPAASSWECSRCGYHNEDFRTKCRVCGSLA